MAPFPLNLVEVFGQYGMYLIYLLIGFAFGYVLEIAGFGHSPKLAAQFYFKDLTVLKVMFTAIIVAMVLIFGASAVGLLEYNLVWVNPTYLWPGILGGVMMGIGFILGGFCPGTSLVAVATAKIDGVLFALGVFFGIFLFGETVDSYSIFWNSSYLGRFTIMDWLGLPAGVVVVGVVLMALFMFWGGEQLERIFGGKRLNEEPRSRYLGAGALLALAVTVLLIGQPTPDQRWNRLAPEKQQLLNERQVQTTPAEVLHTIHDHKTKVILIDVRSEADYNLYHVADARHVPLENLPAVIEDLHLEPPNSVFIVMSNGEAMATEAWKYLTAESVPNVYILAGGVNNWISTFATDDTRIRPTTTPVGLDQPVYEFYAALGAAYPSADPNPEAFEIEYQPVIELQTKRGPSGGGCG